MDWKDVSADCEVDDELNYTLGIRHAGKEMTQLNYRLRKVKLLKNQAGPPTVVAAFIVERRDDGRR